jgi:hypothetical protein
VTALAAGLRTADIKSEGMAVVGTTEMGTSSAGVGSIGGLMEQVLMAIGIHQRGGIIRTECGSVVAELRRARRGGRPTLCAPSGNSLYWQNPGKSRQVGNGDRS